MIEKFILNADDFGMSKAYNDAVLEGFRKGLLTSCSICANGDFFDDAIERIIPKCPNILLGIHLNIIEGKSLTNSSLLVNSQNEFNNSYSQMILKSFDKKFLSAVEDEFRAQIEKIIKVANVSHIDSHVHTHAIPNLFKITAKLAKEYNIPYIRTQYEKPYFTPSFEKHFNLKYPVNLIKVALLNSFTFLNRRVVKKYNLKTNDYLIGVSYTGMMNSDTIYYGLKALCNKKGVAEALIHPCKYENSVQDSHSEEFKITQDEKLIEKIKELN